MIDDPAHPRTIRPEHETPVGTIARRPLDQTNHAQALTLSHHEDIDGEELIARKAALK